MNQSIVGLAIYLLHLRNLKGVCILKLNMQKRALKNKKITLQHTTQIKRPHTTSVAQMFPENGLLAKVAKVDLS